jgi:hypothetical protein
MSTLPIYFHSVDRDNFALAFYQKEKFDVKRLRIKPSGEPRYAGYCHLGHNRLQFKFLTCICLIDGCLSGEKSHDSITRSDVRV